MAWLKSFLKTFFNSPKFGLWTMWASGPVHLLMSLGLVVVILIWGWPVEYRGTQLNLIGIIAIVAQAAAIAAMFLVAGVIKSATVKFGVTEVTINTDDSEENNDERGPSNKRDDSENS